MARSVRFFVEATAFACLLLASSGPSFAQQALVAPGLVEPNGDEREIGSQVIGVIREMKVGEGDAVTAGGVIGVVDNSEQAARLASMQAELALRKSELDRVVKEADRAARQRAEADKERDKREEELRRQLEAMQSIERGIIERQEKLRRQTPSVAVRSPCAIAVRRGRLQHRRASTQPSLE